MNFQESIIKEIGDVLHERKESIAVAESVTAGFLQLALSSITAASAVFKGGITTYTIDEKVRLLDIDASEAAVKNCVSESITEQMARNVARLFDSTWAIATTGFATQVPESNFKQFAFCTIYHHNKILFTKKIELYPHTNPIDAQHFYAESALFELHALLVPGL